MSSMDWAEADRVAVALVTAALHEDLDAARVVIDGLDCGQRARLAYSLAEWVVSATEDDPRDLASRLRILGVRFADTRGGER
jgi:hypothetical protein